MRTGPSAGGAQHRRELGVEQPALLQRQADRRAGRAPGCAGSTLRPLSERASLSPPISRVRTVTGLPSMPRTSAEKTSYCSSSLGQIVAVHVEEFGAHQAEPHRAVGERLLELDRQFEIGLRA